MTSLLAAVVLGLQPGALAPTAKAFELPQPGSGRLTLQAHFRVPFVLGRRESAAWRVLTALMKEGTLDFTASHLLQQGGGVMPKFYLGPDSLCIQTTGVKGSLAAQVQLINSFMRRPRLIESEILAKGKLLESGISDPWARALDVESAEWGRLRTEQVVDLQKQIFRPENLTLVAAGDFEPGSTSAEFEPINRAFPPAPRRSPLRFDPPAPHAVKEKGGVRSITLSLKLSAKSVDQAAASMVLASALTQGKGSSLYRVVREEKGESYTLGGFVQPGPRDWALRMVVLQRSGRSLTPQAVTALLVKDSESWGQAQLKRAKAMALAGLSLDTFDALVSVGPTRIMPGLDAEAFLLGVSQGLIRFDPLEDEIEKVALEALKGAAKQAFQSVDGVASGL